MTARKFLSNLALVFMLYLNQAKYISAYKLCSIEIGKLHILILQKKKIWHHLKKVVKKVQNIAYNVIRSGKNWANEVCIFLKEMSWA